MRIWRLRNSKELQTIIEELDAITDKNTLMDMYRLATNTKHGFWYVNLLNETDHMFYKNFDQRMVI